MLTFLPASNPLIHNHLNIPRQLRVEQLLLQAFRSRNTKGLQLRRAGTAVACGTACIGIDGTHVLTQQV